MALAKNKHFHTSFAHMFCYILLSGLILQKSLEPHFKTLSWPLSDCMRELYMKFNEFYYVSSMLSIIF